MPETVRERFTAGNEYVLRKVYALEDATVRELHEAYRQALRSMYDTLNEVWRTQVSGETWATGDIEARNTLIRQILSEMFRLDVEATGLILERMIAAHDAGLYGTAWNLDNSIVSALNRMGEFPTATTLPVLPVEAVRAQMLAPYLGQTFIDRFQTNRLEFEVRIKRALTQSQIQGEGIYGAQKRIADELGIDISRRTQRDKEGKIIPRTQADKQAHRRNFNRTQMIARTELLRASNLGSLAVFQANSDRLRGWEWQTALDDRVCPICAPLDGEVFTFDNQRVDGGSVGSATVPPPAHPQCRCSTLPVLLDRSLEDALGGPRETFFQWADRRGIQRNRYGQVFERPGREAPKLKKTA